MGEETSRLSSLAGGEGASFPTRGTARERARGRFDELLAAEFAAGAEQFFERLWLEPLAGGMPMVLIGQIQRSGGTLLSRLLDGHAEIRAYPLELHWGPTEYDWPEKRLLAMPPADAFRELAAGNVHQIRRFTIEGYRKANRAGNEAAQTFAFSLALQQRDFLARMSASPPHSRRELLDAFTASFFTAWLDYQSRYRRPRIVTAFGKRHNLGPTVAELFADYPDGRLLTVVRDPASWYASASAHDSELYGDVECALELWSASATASCEAAERWPGQVTVLSFERLVADTATTMRALADVLGIRWAERLAIPSVNGRRALSNSAFAAAREVDTATLNRGAALDHSAAEHIRRHAQPLYEHCQSLCL